MATELIISDSTAFQSVIGFAAKFLNVSEVSLTLTRLAGDASSRSYYRVAGQQGPASLIVARYPASFDTALTARDRLKRKEQDDPDARLTFANDPCAHIETTALFLDAGLPVPEILDTSGSAGLMLLRDLGDSRLQDWLLDLPEPDLAAQAADAYRQAVDLIVRIQESGISLSAGSICSALAFDAAKFKWELDFFFTHYFRDFLDAAPDPKTAADAEAEFWDLSRELAALPQALVHRDYHARNLMLHHGTMYMIDYQDARLGPETYDLASLIVDPYVNVDEELADQLKRHFVKAKQKSSVQLARPDEFERSLDLAIAQRMLKVAGTYSYQAAVKKNHVYLKYIEPALKAALPAIKRLNGMKTIEALLEDNRRRNGRGL